ncbi:GNAT family N-acetyltransferase [Desulfosarcina sp.]|uniref:GNAT family N-acetyltransferase n=1 Tax=Desulfosarcina sp. TaxID=2027861 RepID=UPI0035678245
MMDIRFNTLAEDDHSRIASLKTMTAASSFSILLIQPSAVLSATPPSTLTQARMLACTASMETHRWDVRLEALKKGDRRFLERLEWLSARYHARHGMSLNEMPPAQFHELVVALNERKPKLRLSLCVAIDREMAVDFTIPAEGGSIVQIQWRVRGPLPDVGFFKAFSRAGVWNHLMLDGAEASSEACRTVASQPNIIHSWEISHPGGRQCHSNASYGQVDPLPGRPLWQTMNDPVDRFLLVDRLTKDHMLRLRVDDDGERLFTVGATLRYHFLPPDRLPDGYLEAICAMVAAGGTVAATHVRFNLQRAYLIGYVQEKGVIVGNSSLKNPRPEYIEAVQRQTGLNLTGFVERGYTSVRPEYRGLGIGTRLLEGLTQRAGDRKIFSVIAEDNAATKIIALRNRTRKVATYFSEKAGKPVGIWMPDWMIDTDERRIPK